jgi:hypothetical protein
MKLVIELLFGTAFEFYDFAGATGKCDPGQLLSVPCSTLSANSSRQATLQCESAIHSCKTVSCAHATSASQHLCFNSCPSNPSRQQQ